MRPRAKNAILGLPVFLAFGAFSLSSAVGFAAKNRGSVSEDRALATAKLLGVKTEIEETEAKLRSFGNSRPFAVLQESLRGLEQDRRWQSSKACQEATTETLRSFCKGYFEVKAEAARASEAGRLEVRIAELKIETRRLEDQGAGREADNQAAVLARLLGLQTTNVERGLMLFLAILVEIGAALGLYFATGHMRPELSHFERRGRGLTIIEGEAVTVGRRKPTSAPLKQITAATPRRVPRLKQSPSKGR